jgi:stearoyl-CoA desaturase (delta-9 desaturase)
VIANTTVNVLRAGPDRSASLRGGHRRRAAHVSVYLFVIVPFVALLAAVPVAWGWGLTWLDVVLTGFWYTVTMLGVTVGYHRYFTHRAFRAGRKVRILLAVLGSLAVQGPILHWVADHRRHHAFADREGDPHSPWLFGTTSVGLARGFLHAHVGWILDRGLTNQQRFAPDLLADRDIRVVHRLFAPLTAVTMLTPAMTGGLLTMSWRGFLTAFFWASLVRVCLAHHVSWSVNSICHMLGERPFTTRDRAANFAPLALLSMGEAWHNLHHADPTCARHGVDRGQVDVSARVIWLMERMGWVSAARWPSPDRVQRMRRPTRPRQHDLAGASR